MRRALQLMPWRFDISSSAQVRTAVLLQPKKESRGSQEVVRRRDNYAGRQEIGGAGALRRRERSVTPMPAAAARPHLQSEHAIACCLLMPCQQRCQTSISMLFPSRGRQRYRPEPSSLCCAYTPALSVNPPVLLSSLLHFVIFVSSFFFHAASRYFFRFSRFDFRLIEFILRLSCTAYACFRLCCPLIFQIP